MIGLMDLNQMFLQQQLRFQEVKKREAMQEARRQIWQQVYAASLANDRPRPYEDADRALALFEERFNSCVESETKDNAVHGGIYLDNLESEKADGKPTAIGYDPGPEELR